MRVWRSEDRFFSSNLKDLKDLFKDSKKYYRNVILGGLITVSVSSSVSAYMYLVQGAVSPLTICVVSSVILHASMESVRRGVFDLSDVIKGVILTVVYASAALYLTRLNILLASILIALVMMKLVSSSTSFGQYELNEYLQNMVN
ncbi:hypothetical protein MCGE09_00583 [Thaumarchaeota archaeon SCGC AB-539-E09]|nr:hypothetical protein MCGE09_00583 [Thaumarchaeota archaeon SCGC AB-539-E09]